MKLENERLSVEISEIGAEVTRIFDKKTETDITSSQSMMMILEATAEPD